LAPPVPALGPTLLALFQPRNGDLWLSGETGVARRRGNQWKVFLAASQTAPESALFFAGAAEDRVWCATTDRVWAFDGREWDMLRGGFDHINDLTRSRNGDLWVASNSGLHRLTTAGWIENGLEEGLPGTVVRNVCEDRRGRLWVGTSQGLSLHHPEADPDPPRTEILAPSEQRIPEGGSINLAFNAQDKWKFTPRRRLLYSHRLDNQDWSPFQEFNTATLPDLPAGEHSFFVRAMDRNGNVETKPAQLGFTVALPWFKETRLVGIAALGAAVALFFAALAFNRHLRLRRSYAEVERKVAERTRELEIASRELVHSQKMNALGTLAAGIAHDFNNILSIVKGSAQIIEENLENPSKIQTRLDRIKTVVEQGAGIVQAMLGFGRRSDGTPEPCDLNAVVDSTITLLGDRFLRDVEVHFERAPVLPQVSVAKDLVQQILLNFIFNAAESMSGPKQVVLRTSRLERLPESLFLKPAEAGAYAGISVQDYGCGIAPEDLVRIFEPFFTTKALSSRRGTGLGLSMAYELAKHMNAGLSVESTVGRGSKFTLILPVSNTPAAPETAIPDSTRPSP
jgi:signal transduction histidine kinase